MKYSKNIYMADVLDGINILVTRPEQQAEAICKSIESLGGTAIHFPTIEIKQSGYQQTTQANIDNLTQYDIGIFISRNAVEWTLRLLGNKQSELDNLNLFAIGTATANALGKALSGKSIINGGVNSESLLEDNALSTDSVRGKKVIIFRGENGREYLAVTLRERGAQVDYIEVYRRECPEYGNEVIDELWISNTPDIVIITSNKGLENLFALLNNKQRELLLNKQIVVMGERILDFSITFGFNIPPIVAEESSDEGILKAVVNWAASKRTV